MAMAEESSNVVVMSRALQDLTPAEHEKLDKRRVQMRWVLTRKRIG